MTNHFLSSLDTVLIILSAAFFILLIGGAIWAIAYINKLKHYYSDILTKKSFENDETIKKALILEAEKKNLEENTAKQLENSETRINELKAENTQRINAQKADYETRLDNQRKDYESRLDNQKKEFLELETRFKEAFENLSARILEDKSKKFTEINKENIENILKPLNEKIKEFKDKVEESYINESKERFSLKNEIIKLVETESAMKQTTENLTKALKGDSKTQGDWGEIILATLLEASGLIKGEGFEVQKSLTGVENEQDGLDLQIEASRNPSSFSYAPYANGQKKLRPDVIVHLPENRDMIIDSKVSLTDYEKYISADDGDINKSKYLKDHINSVKKHIDELSKKRYEKAAGVKSLELVIMFVPIDYAFSVAVKEDGRILTDAYKKNIIIATPSILLLMLKTVANIWYQTNLDRNARFIMDEAGKLYEKFISFMENMRKIDKGINEAKSAYENAYKQLSTGRGNVIKRLEDIKASGINTTKSLPENIEYDNEV